MTRVAALACVLAGCTGPADPGALSLAGITPASSPSDLTTTVTIAGRNFTRPIRSSVDDGTTSVGVLAVALDTLPLADGRVRDQSTIEATVPAGLAPGTYDVRVQLGDQSDVLEDAYTVEAPGGGTMPPDAGPMPMPAPYAISGQRWLLPCLNTLANRNCNCDLLPVIQEVTLTGTSGELWRVSARIRGVLEAARYDNGVAVGGWYLGGAPAENGNNVYTLTIDSPPQYYYINPGTPTSQRSFLYDYPVTFLIAGDATVTFSSSGLDGFQWGNYDENGNPITIPGVTTVPAPYDGQFAQIDVTGAVLQ